MLAQHARAEPEIAPQRGEEEKGPCFSLPLLQQGNIAKLPPRRVCSVLPGHTLIQEPVREQLHVLLQFIIEFAIRASLRKQRSHSGR
jgi:hypothetical protein